MKALLLFSLLLCGACTKETAAPTPAPVQAGANVGGGDGQNCLDVYDPVCSNGVTYPNACYARKAGVTTYTRGACGGDI